MIGVVGRTGALAVKLVMMASKLDFEDATTHHRDIMENSAQALQPRRECVYILKRCNLGESQIPVKGVFEVSQYG